MNKFVTLFILMLLFLLEELYYWLPVTTIVKLANDAQFGNWHISNEARNEKMQGWILNCFLSQLFHWLCGRHSDSRQAKGFMMELVLKRPI